MSTQSDLLEPVAVTMTVMDWAEILGALADSKVASGVKGRITSTIYQCVEATERTLS